MAGPFRARAAGTLVLLLSAIPLCRAGEGTPAGTAPEEPIMAPTRASDGAPALRMSTDYGNPALGFGTYEPMGQVEARGFRVGPANVRVSAQTGIGYNDNVTLSQTKNGSMFYTFAPAVAAAVEGGTQRFYAVYRGNYGAYSSSLQSNYADHNLSLVAASGWSSRLRTLLAYDFLKGHTPRGLTTSTLTDSEEWTLLTARATVNYGAPGAQGGLQGDVAYTQRRFTSSSVNAFGEYDGLELGGTFHYRLSGKTSALFRTTWLDINHPGDQSLDNREMRYEAGVTWEALAATTGRVVVGYTTKDFDTGVRANFAGPRFEAGVTWRPRTYSTFELVGRRFLVESYEVGSSFAVNTVGSAGWTHTWGTGIASTVNYTYGKVSLGGLARTDTYQNFAARVSYPLRRWARLGAELRHDSRASTSSILEYTRNITLLTLEAAL